MPGCVFVCVCVCVRACVRVCARVRACVRMLCIKNYINLWYGCAMYLDLRGDLKGVCALVHAFEREMGGGWEGSQSE